VVVRDVTLPDMAVRLLGRVLRLLREDRGWTREELTARLFASTGQEISTQTVATYEQGTRAMTVARLAALCHTLDARPADVWSTVDNTIYGPHGTVHGGDTSGGAGGGQPVSIRVDLRKVVRLTGPGLAPVREWARIRLDLGPVRTVLTPPAITNLATVCGVTVAQITATLLSVGESQ
jgi:transcriptional regulator with XRE-family HTH domain